jgi:integrase/recombinase XerD
VADDAGGVMSQVHAPIYTSSLAERMDALVGWKRAQGYDYNAGAKDLARFDRFVEAQGYDADYLSTRLMVDYRQSLSGASANSQQQRFSCVKVLASYLHLRVEGSEPYVELPRRRVQVLRVYLYSETDLQGLLAACMELRGRHRSRIYQHLISLLLVTGLRIDEALSLTWADVDLTLGMLHVCGGKFTKDRDLPLDASTVEALRDYRQVLRRAKGGKTSSALFANPRQLEAGPRLSHATVYATFRRLLKISGVGENATHRPRLHDSATVLLARRIAMPPTPCCVGIAKVARCRACCPLAARAP